jgi:hypothetical protein
MSLLNPRILAATAAALTFAAGLRATYTPPLNLVSPAPLGWALDGGPMPGTTRTVFYRHMVRVIDGISFANLGDSDVVPYLRRIGLTIDLISKGKYPGSSYINRTDRSVVVEYWLRAISGNAAIAGMESAWRAALISYVQASYTKRGSDLSELKELERDFSSKDLRSTLELTQALNHVACN